MNAGERGVRGETPPAVFGRGPGERSWSLGEAVGERLLYVAARSRAGEGWRCDIGVDEESGASLSVDDEGVSVCVRDSVGRCGLGCWIAGGGADIAAAAAGAGGIVSEGEERVAAWGSVNITEFLSTILPRGSAKREYTTVGAPSWSVWSSLSDTGVGIEYSSGNTGLCSGVNFAGISRVGRIVSILGLLLSGLEKLNTGFGVPPIEYKLGVIDAAEPGRGGPSNWYDGVGGPNWKSSCPHVSATMPSGLSARIPAIMGRIIGAGECVGDLCGPGWYRGSLCKPRFIMRPLSPS